MSTNDNDNGPLPAFARESVRFHDPPGPRNEEGPFEDHFSLSHPSDSVTFRNETIHIYQLGDAQFQLVQRRQRQEQTYQNPGDIILSLTQEEEEAEGESPAAPKNQGRTFAKEVAFGSAGLLFIRMYQAFSAIVVLGSVFLFMSQLILYLFLGLVMDSGLSSGFHLDTVQFLGTVLSLRYFIYAASTSLAMATSFVRDAFAGHLAVRSAMDWKSVVMEWVSFVLFLAVPICVGIFHLWTRAESWWARTAQTWIATLSVCFVVYATLIVLYELQMALELLIHDRNLDFDKKNQQQEEEEEEKEEQRRATPPDSPSNAAQDRQLMPIGKEIRQLVRRAVLLRQIHLYAGVITRAHLFTGIKEAPTTASFFRHKPLNPLDPLQESPSDAGATIEDGEDGEEGEGEERRSPHVSDRSSSADPSTSEIVWERRTWYTWCTIKLVQWKPQLFYSAVTPPRRQYSMHEVLETTPLITSKTWSLDRIYCRSREDPTIVVLAGQSAVTTEQALSSVICSFLGVLASFLAMVAAFRWLELSLAISFVLSLALFIVCCVPSLVSITRLYQVYQDFKEREATRKGVSKRDVSRGGSDEAVFQFTETYRITTPNHILCWFMLVVEVGIFFVFPLSALYAVGNLRIAAVFIACGLLSMLREFVSATVILQELGSFDSMQTGYLAHRLFGIAPAGSSKGEGEEGDNDNNNDDATRADEVFRAKRRAARIVGTISQGRQRDVWTRVFLGLTALIFFIFVGAYQTGEHEGTEVGPSQLLHDFRYEPRAQGSLAYPTCQMRDGFEMMPDEPETAMLDYVYLSAMTYAKPEYVSEWLDPWFGQGVAKDEAELVQEFRDSHTDLPSAVLYRFITFPDMVPNFGIVAIRGTITGWDTLTDGQLWMAAIFAQFVRAILPLGAIWNPILDEIVYISSVVERGGLQRVAFYQQTSAFLEHVRSEHNFTTLRVAGHSLGGGLAMISGVQTGTPAIALSGPNSVLSRRTFDPPLKLSDMNRLTFNIMPDHDIIAMIDDPAQSVQRIACHAPSNDLFGCHTSTRSLCEIAYTCGSGSRPVLCACVLRFGYPVPRALGNRTFAEACGVDQATVDDAIFVTE